MRRILISLMFVILLSSLASAEILINQQPDKIYNLGDSITIPITIKSSSDISGIFQMDLICNGKETNFYKNGISLAAGEEKQIDSTLILTKSATDNLMGNCKIKGTLGEAYVLTNDFQISNIINLQPENNQTEFNPGESILFNGKATKDNGKDVEGFIRIQVMNNDTTIINQTGTIQEGEFSVNVSLPEEMKAGEYPVKMDAYEKDVEGNITNEGFANLNLQIAQIPTSLEIIFENQTIQPGKSLKVKTILHDQTGEPIDSSSIITIKDENNKILDQAEKNTDEYLEYPIAQDEAPAEWKVFAVSNKLTNEADFNIAELKKVDVELINKTIIVTNIGNVLYNDTILVKVGNKSININALLDVGETQKYALTAPNGEYNIEVIADDEDKISGQSVLLTGDAIDVKQIKEGIVNFISYPIAWIFIILVLGGVAFIIFKKGYKKTFVGYISHHMPKKKNFQEKPAIKKNTLIDSPNQAELSLSLKGERQNADIICVKIKNFDEIKSKKADIKGTLDKLSGLAEENKAIIYENQDCIIFIFAPSITKTFQNEKTAIKVAQKIREILSNHNRLFKQRIEFGISINYGSIVAKQEAGNFQFMSLGTLMTNAKKIAGISKEEVLLGEQLKDKLGAEVKTEKNEENGAVFYRIKEIKDREEHKQFLQNFVKRLNEEKKK